MNPDLASFPDCPEPDGAHRILAQLPDKGPSHVRYQSAHGVQTGQQVGRFLVRDQLLEIETRRLCFKCREPTIARGTMAVIIDQLDGDDPVMGATRRDHALAYADELSRRDVESDEFLDWICVQMHRGFDDKDPEAFSIWRERRDSVEESA